jgi:hypothetical protein
VNGRKAPASLNERAPANPSARWALSRLWHIVDAVSPALDSTLDTAAAPGGRLE